MAYVIIKESELYHHGIKGMKWGIRRFQNPDGTYTEAGKRLRQRQANSAKARQEAREARQERRTIAKEAREERRTIAKEAREERRREAAAAKEQKQIEAEEAKELKVAEDAARRKKLLTIGLVGAGLVGATYAVAKMASTERIDDKTGEKTTAGKAFVDKIKGNAKAAPGEFFDKLAEAPSEIARKAGETPAKIVGAFAAGIAATLTMNTLNTAVGKDNVQAQIERYNALNKKSKVNLNAFEKKEKQSDDDDDE